ncbi:MAG: DMT family transporter [Thermoproteota archaeon]
MSNRKSELTGCLYIAVAAVIWGSNGVIVNHVPLDAYSIAFFRVLFASLVLTPLLFLTQRNEMLRTAKAWRSMFALGAFLSLGWVFLFQSMQLIAIASAVLLNYMAPVFVALLAPLFLKEKVEKTTVFALVLCIVGMLIISFPHGLSGDLNLSGVLFGLLAGLAYAGFIILSKKTVSSYSGTSVALYSYLASTVFLSPSLVSTNISLDFVSWLLLLFLGVFNTGFAVTLYLNGLRSIKAQRAVVFTYLEPASAAFFGFLFLAQQPTINMLTGGLLILFASYLASSK